MKQARLNSTMLLSKYEDMLDALDLNSVAKATQINLVYYHCPLKIIRI